MDYNSRRYALLNQWDPRHLRTVNRLLRPAPDTHLLEVGCGRGHLTKRLREAGVNARGIDVNPHAADHAVTDAVKTMSAEELGFPSDSFDQVCSVHAIEHIPDPDAAMAEMARVVRPGGQVMLIYPAEPIRGLYSIPASIILYNTPFKSRTIHLHRFTPKRIAALGVSHGLEQVHSEFNLFSSQFVSLLKKPA